jgi:hypothetical protein
LQITTSGIPGGRYYAFNYIATFEAVYRYVSTTGDTALLEERASDGRPFLDAFMGLATHWKKLPRTPHSPFLVSYGGDKDFFLEVVPCYVHAVAALQASNAWMMLIAAEVIERSALVTASRAAQNAELVRELQVAAANVTSALVQHSWSTDEMRSTEVCSQALSRADHDRTCACHVAQSTNADIVEGRGDGPPRPRVEIPRTGGVWRALYPDGGSRPVRQVRRTHTYLDAHACPRKYTRVPSQAHTRDTDDNSFERTHVCCGRCSTRSMFPRLRRSCHRTYISAWPGLPGMN